VKNLPAGSPFCIPLLQTIPKHFSSNGRNWSVYTTAKRCSKFYHASITPSQRNYFKKFIDITKRHSSTDDNFEIVRDPKWIERAKRWILIVDDEESIRLAIGDYLFDKGYQVMACADADAVFEAISIIPDLEEENEDLPSIPDVIVSDIRMPGKDGLELLGLIRTDNRLSRIPVVLVTAKGMTQDRVAGYKAGADYYLSKPFNPEELVAILDNAILRRSQMTGKNGKLVDLKQQISDVKKILRRNGKEFVKATDVYLTPREIEVLELLCKGYTNGEIASNCGISVITANRVVQALYSKTCLRNRTELLRWALQTGQIEK